MANAFPEGFLWGGAANANPCEGGCTRRSLPPAAQTSVKEAHR